MASRKRRGLGEALNDIIARAQEARITLSEEGDLSGTLPPGRPKRDRGYDIFSPQEGPPSPTRKAGPGLGPSGLERIQEELIDRSDLPKPEYIYPIKQSTKASFSTKRPDKYVEFYKAAASQQSTRVYAMQWIPTYRKDGRIVGDIFVAFARPSNGKNSLFVYKEKDESEWATLKVGGEDSSFGRAVKSLGSPDSYDDSLFSFYEEIHPDHETWIYDSMDWWAVIRPGNESVGSKRKRTVLGRAVADIKKELGF